MKNENGELKHKEFLAEPGIDSRRELAERLVKDVPENACVLVYNKGFENGVIQKLAIQYPDLSEKLLKISENLKDLMLPFSRRMYYAKEMEGSYSIKEVLPALFPNDEILSYKNLEIIHNGTDAMSLYEGLEKKSKEEQEKIKKALLEYCKLDTLAMVKILEKLKQL